MKRVKGGEKEMAKNQIGTIVLVSLIVALIVSIVVVLVINNGAVQLGPSLKGKDKYDITTIKAVFEIIQNSRSSGDIILGLSQIGDKPVTRINGAQYCASTRKYCLLSFVKVITPDRKYDPDNFGIINCGEVIDLNEIQQHPDFVQGSRVIVEHLCTGETFR